VGSRRKARESILQMLFQHEFVKGSIQSTILLYWKNNPASNDIRIFANELVVDISACIDDLDNIIMESSTNWKMSRMAAVDRNILRLAVYEMKFREDIPVNVSINEAVEIAKRFGTSESSAFVNGILDNIAKRNS